jgi:maleylpyruvate isomerase
MKLYTYFRSSSAYRVRIALNLKSVRYEPVFINIRRGEQRAADYLALNPQGLVPILVDGDQRLTQSMAILEYLEETHPQPPLLPAEAHERARARSLAQLIACDIQPLNNTRVLEYLETTLKHHEEARMLWYRHWIAQGFEVIESQLDPTHPFCHEDAPTFADICLVPQVYNALRYGCDLKPYPKLVRVYETCAALPPFRAAAPENQPDAQA